MYWALLAYGESATDWDVLYASCATGTHSEGSPVALLQISVCPQHRIGDYRVDFLISAYETFKDGTKTLGRVVVEVDGHDFHERTKEQARRDRSRDRTLQTMGYGVFRFTGSEIFADPVRCAKEAIDQAVKGFLG